MTERERYIATLTFQKPDQIYFDPGNGRKSTREQWHKQGLPPDVDDYHAYIRERLGIPHEAGPTKDKIEPGVSFRMIPQFEEKVVEKREHSLVVQDWKGNICEISDDYDISYLRNPIDFVTRNWIKCPVESHDDWEQMKERYKPDDPKRFPADFAERGKKLKEREYVSGLVDFPGPFWQLREWLGFENLCMLFIDDPQWLHEMIDFWEEFIAQVLERTLKHHVPDFIVLSEDMAYKQKSMISPAMAREFLLPCWRRWCTMFREAGVPVIEMDSDGYIGQLIPLWIEAGFNCNSPLEVAAGNDVPAYYKEFGTQIAYRGGVDKRAMAKGGQVIKDEIDRLTPAIKGGGVLPSCDHGVPADVSWPNFIEYCKLLAQTTGWL